MEPSAAPRSELQVLVIGPMGEKELPEGKTVQSTEHITNICKAVEKCSTSLEGIKLVPISAEQIKLGGISEFVLLNIDRADVAIADISFRGANVFYELAVLHALGRPVVLLDYSEQAGKPPFYVKDERVHGVRDFAVEELTTVLRGVLSDERSIQKLKFNSSNAISNFYSVPLADASAAAGLATGYFTNFAQWMLMEGNGVMDRFNQRNRSRLLRAGDQLTHLVVIKPDTIHSMQRAREMLKELPGYKDHEYQEDAKLRNWKFSTAGGKYVVDFPTPLLSLPSTPSYAKVRELFKKYPYHELDEIRRFDAKLVDTYMSTIQRLARYTSGISVDRLKFMTIEELNRDLRGT